MSEELQPEVSQTIRVTDRVGVLGIDATEYPQADHVTSITTDGLLQAIELLDGLGWDELDVVTVPSKSQDYPLLILRPPHEAFFGGEQAGLAIAPLTDQGRGVGDE